MQAWPIILKPYGLRICTNGTWVYWDTGQGQPPRLDHLTRGHLPHSLFPVDGWRLPDGTREGPGSTTDDTPDAL